MAAPGPRAAGIVYVPGPGVEYFSRLATLCGTSTVLSAATGAAAMSTNVKQFDTVLCWPCQFRAQIRVMDHQIINKDRDVVGCHAELAPSEWRSESTRPDLLG